MPKEFEKCVSSGGRVRTVKPTPQTYKPICFPRGGGGRSTAGETHRRQAAGQRKR